MGEIIPEETQEQEVSESPILGAFSGILSSVLDIAQQNIVERIQTVVEDLLEQAQVTATDVLEQTKTTINEIIQNAAVLFIIVLLGFVGFIFTIIGLSLWLGEVSGLGTWFGFLIVGIIIFIVSLIAALVQKNKQQ
ncbi:MAG: phage holin family protein [Patescibacteria group bacterium]|nr:phage holin family protein [Patescibacteria group bacterium]